MFETIISGVTIFVIGQLINKLVIDPIHALKTAFAEVSQGFLINAPFIYNPSAISDEERGVVRERMLALSSQLNAKLMLVPAYPCWRYAFSLPEKAKVHEAAQCLVAIGNWVYSSSNVAPEHIIKNVQSASDILGIYISPSNRVSEDLLNAAIESSFGRKTEVQQGAQLASPPSGS